MEFIFNRATKEDTGALAQLMDEVRAALEHPEWFALYDFEEYIQDILDTDKGRVWKAVDPDTRQIAAMYTVVYPGTDPDNLGRDIGLSAPELLRVAHMDAVVVHPLYRGYGLQQKLTMLVEQEVCAEGFRYLMCTVHPDNVYSRINMEKCGYRVVKEALKYGGLPRLIFLKTTE